MEIPSKYSPEQIENRWYDYWMKHNFFRSTPDEREPYTIVIPPPNVTGVLHMGHMLNNTLQDVLVRRARMTGKNACWVPGTDHASIATEAKVVAKLAEEGVKKSDLTREQFLEHAWDWTHKHGGIILEQLKKLGASCDWERTCFTMDKERSESVLKVFVDLYGKGLIYRGVRMVNWDPAAKTALSDEEVNYKEQQGNLYYLRYRLADDPEKYAVIATTRPETILGDTAVCINPNDPKNAHLKGKKVIVPIANRIVPVIEDEYVDIEFGTGVLKVTPAHDVNDYMLGEKYRLDSIDIFNDDGTLNEHGQQYAGMDRFAVRKKIEQDLEAAGLMEKIEPYINNVGFSERTDVPIEPKLSMQWFLKMEALSKPAFVAVMDDVVKLHPPKFKNTYRHWMENVKDWCISRQLWWGHRIPAYYLPEGGYVVAETDEKALELAQRETGNSHLTMADLRQDEDCLDTWFSSWLWPISVFDGINKPDNEDINYYYPTNDLVTAPEILFFWVARMIIAGYEYRDDRPFQNVYLTGIVRDKQGKKMSKSLGNSPDPIELMNQYSADGVRMGMLLCSSAGNDILFDLSQVELGRNFCNKIWNAFRLVRGWEVDETLAQPESSATAVAWFSNKLQATLAEIEDHFEKYRISDAMMSAYKLMWDDFCSWYLEMIKPAYQQPIDPTTLTATIGFFDQLMRILHPFMPFLTEEIWQLLQLRNEGESVMVSEAPKAGVFDEQILKAFDFASEVIIAIRAQRAKRNILNKEAIALFIKKNEETPQTQFDGLVAKLCNISEIAYIDEKPENCASFIVRSTELFIPIGENVNKEEERAKLQKELDYTKGFLDSVMKKLNNERFVGNAPEKVLESEHKKKADAEARIAVIEEQLKNL